MKRKTTYKIQNTLYGTKNYVQNTKYIVWNEDESKALQMKLFEIGCEWINGGQVINHTEHPFLIVDKDFKITFRKKHYYKEFENIKNYYNTVESVIRIEIKQEQPKPQPEPKFDPNTLEPFDRVLARDSVNNAWKARFFDRYFCKRLLTTDGLVYEYCIPYNDETKHLHGTTEDEPEFYKLD